MTSRGQFQPKLFHNSTGKTGLPLALPWQGTSFLVELREFTSSETTGPSSASVVCFLAAPGNICLAVGNGLTKMG